MSIQPVSRERHAHLRWKRFSSFAFAASTTLVPLAAAEISQAALALPLAFIERDGHWSMAAVLGLMPGQNLYVDAGGVWLGRYVPAAFRGYPFLIGARADGEPTLCIDASSGLVTQAEGEPFFDEAGSLSPTVTQVTRFLEQTAQSEAVLVDACETLARFAVLEAWPITVQDEEGPRQVNGLHRISEATLNRLDDRAFGAVRQGGALAVAYAQLLSMGNLADLGKLAQARAQHAALARAAQQASAAPPVTLPNDSTIDWDWSKVGR